jgi:hypothetical protein
MNLPILIGIIAAFTGFGALLAFVSWDETRRVKRLKSQAAE